MNRMVNPVPPGDDLDALLGAFFKKEVPRPWPAFQPPRPKRVLPFRPAAPRPRFFGSRLALAAAVALLLLGGWLLSGTLATPLRSGSHKIEIDRNGKAGRPLLPPAPLVEPDRKPGKVRSSLNLEQDDEGRTGIRITVEPLPSNK
jgi:hypothetical protein